MDSLTRDVEKIFNQNQLMGYQELYDGKTVAYKAVKRLFDIMAASAALIVLSPVFLVTALAILLEDGRPVFFVQPRAGKDMQPFRMYKFRSMFKNADQLFAALQEQNEQSGNAFKIKDDPRITKVGKFIRKYSVDELPQLINVLKGEMSIVGPRPILTFQMEACNKYQKHKTWNLECPDWFLKSDGPVLWRCSDPCSYLPQNCRDVSFLPLAINVEVLIPGQRFLQKTLVQTSCPYPYLTTQASCPVLKSRCHMCRVGQIWAWYLGSNRSVPSSGAT